MYLGKVVGSIVSTKKNEKLLGCKFLTVELQNRDNEEIVVVDNVGAGIGDVVLVTIGHNAMYGMGEKENIPIDAIIIGIVD
ncbi:MAG: EutN/CcmL family microcompartment protein [Eubacteriales bacterium]